MRIRIAVDAVGGDHGPEPIVAGALAAAAELPLDLTLVGPVDRVRAALAAVSAAGASGVSPSDVPGLSLVDSGQAIGMDEPASSVLRRRSDASIQVAVSEVASGRAAAVYSSGHTGATVVAAYSQFGMLPGVDRPALAATIPTRRRSAVLLDVGATVECRPQHLLQFATMGVVYAHAALGLATPRIGLLSIGSEATKGNDLTRDAHRLLRASCPTFIGNVEARDVYADAADVIVCDGFTGNIALKLSEGLVEMIGDLLRDERGSDDAHGRGALARRLDPSEYGAVPLLGVSGLTLVGHGRSSARAVRNGIAMAYRHASADILGRIQLALAPPGASKT